MSNKSSILAPQHHKSIQELAHEDAIKREKVRQKEIFDTIIIPFLKDHTKTMFEATFLVQKTKEEIMKIYQYDLMMAEQKRVSETNVELLGLEERLEKAKCKDESAFVKAFKGESLAKVLAMLDAFNGWTRQSREQEDKNRDVASFPFSDLV